MRQRPGTLEGSRPVTMARRCACYAAAALGLIALTTRQRACRDRAHPRRHPRVPARGLAAAGARHPAAGRLRARVGPRRRAGAGSDRHGEEAGRPPRAAALRRLAVPQGDRPGARRRLHRAREGRGRRQQLQERRRGCSPPKAPRRRRCRSRPSRRAATSARSRRRARSCCGSRTACARTSKTTRRRSRPPPPTPAPAPRAWSGPCSSRWSARSRSAPASRCWPRTASCTATGCDENRTRNAAGGILIGAGAALTIGGTYVTIVRSRGGDPVTGVALAFRW